MEEMSKKEKNTTMAVIAYIIFFLPLLSNAKDDPFVRYHVKQGLLLFIGWIVAGVIGYIPFIGQMLTWLLNLFLFILMIVGIMNAIQGERKVLPVIGQFADKFKF